MNEQVRTGPQQPGMPQRQVPPPPVRPPGSPSSIRPSAVPQQGHIPTDLELEPISLVEDSHTSHANEGGNHPAAPVPKKITAIGAELVQKKHIWKRQPAKTGTGACRVKSFHGKYSEQGLEYLDNAINEWLDANPDIEIKFVTPTVNVFEGKIRENALVLNVWY